MLRDASARPPPAASAPRGGPRRRAPLQRPLRRPQAAMKLRQEQQTVGAAAAPASSEQLFTELKATMPALGHSWTGALGEWVAYNGSGTGDIKDYGGVLHLWREGPQGEVQVLYSQAPSQRAGSVTHSPPAGLRDDVGGTFTWDEAALGAHTTAWTFTPSGPQLQPYLEDSAGGAPLHTTIRNFPVGGGGMLLALAALPPAFGQDAGPGQGGFGWWMEASLLQVEGADAWQRSVVGLSWSPQDGALAAHRHFWQQATSPTELSEAAAEGLASQGRPRAVRLSSVAMPLQQGRSQGIGAYLEGVGERLGRGSRTRFTYTALGEEPSAATGGATAPAARQQQLVVSREQGCEFTTAGGGGVVSEEIRYPCQVYARVPLDLQAAAASGSEVVLEVGAVALDGSIGRWLATYSTAGDRRLTSVAFERFPVAQHQQQQ